MDVTIPKGGFFMKKLLSMILVIAIVLSFSLTAFAYPSFSFDDVEATEWYNRYLEKATDNGWMNGVGDRSFDPNGTLSRAMFVTILHRMANEPAPKQAATFSDVVKGSWYENAVAWAAEMGIVTGYPNGTFGVGDPLTREQMTTILFRTAVAEGMNAVTMEENLESFADSSAISEYAITAMNWAVGRGFITGTGKGLEPKGTSTRAQAAAVLCRFDTREESATITREDLQKAVVELAWDYAIKGSRIQYDSVVYNDIYQRAGGGNYRLNEDVAPEFGTADTTIFSVCSDYTHKVYQHALNECFYGNPTDWITQNMYYRANNVYGQDCLVALYRNDAAIDSYRINKWQDNHEKRLTAAEMRQFFLDWEKNLQPGDLLLPNGHAMIYIGNGNVLDCAGGKYNMDSGKDNYEGTGAVSALRTVIGSFVDGTEIGGGFAFPEGKEGNTPSFAVLRLLDLLVDENGRGLPATEIPEITRSRMETPAMDIDRTVSTGAYGSAVSGGELTYTISVRNATRDSIYLTWMRNADPSYNGTDYKGVTVTEPIPEGTVFVSATEGGVYKDGKVTWHFDIAAGDYKSPSFTVKVTAPVGSVITADGGYVNAIPSNSLITTVGGEKFSASDTAALREFYYRYYDGWEKTYGLNYTDGITLAEEVYSKVLGKKLDIPAVQDLMDAIFKPFYMVVKTGGYWSRPGNYEFGWVHTPVENVYETNPMLVRGYMGGMGIWTPNSTPRVTEFRSDYLEPGDIVFHVNLTKEGEERRTVTDYKTLVILGNGNYLTLDENGKAIRERGTTEMWRAFQYDAFFVLRPSQTGSLADSGFKVDPEGEPITNAETKQARQDAVVASAWAFIDKEEKMQYDAIAYSATTAANGGNNRAAIYVAPEDINSDANWHGTVHALMLNFFMDALEYAVAPHATAATYNRLPNLMDSNNTVYAWESSDFGARVTASEVLAMLEPGDIVESSKNKSFFVYGMYLGDGQFFTYENSNAQRYQLTTGEERTEEGGAVKIVDINTVLNDENLQDINCLHVVRFVETPEYDRAWVTAQAKSRQQYPRMVIDRTVNVGPYATVTTGAELTYTVEITNKGTAAYTALPISETVPEGTEFLKADGAIAENGKLTWTLDVAAGETKTISYTVKVTAEAGARIVANGGKVAEIPSNSISTTVGKELITADAAARMTELAGKSAEELTALLGTEGKDALAMARAAYAYILTGNAGTDASRLVRDGSEVYQMFSEGGKNSLKLYTMPTLDATSYKELRTMIVDNYYGGYRVHVDNARDRLSELRCDHLQAGDVLNKVEGQGDEYVIYLGNGKFLQALTADNTMKVVGEEALTTCFKTSYEHFTLSRPSHLVSAADLK